MGKERLIPDIYDKIGNILKEFKLDNAAITAFTTDELYPLYLQQYPDDEEFVEKHSRATLKMYVPGMFWEYSRKVFDDPDKPAIQFLRRHTYRFI